MNSSEQQLKSLEDLMLHQFKSEPFHNLPLIYGNKLKTVVGGGTCSDKTLSFIDAASKAGFNVRLHTGFIDGQEVHRLARVRIGDELYFADVGNGWPALKLYSSQRITSFSCFGMKFTSQVCNGRVSVFHERQGRETLQLEIDVKTKPESEIRKDIALRFNSGIEYPFSNSLRFSQIVGERFLFLRGNRLEIYSENLYEVLDEVKDFQLSDTLKQYFGHEVRIEM